MCLCVREKEREREREAPNEYLLLERGNARVALLIESCWLSLSCLGFEVWGLGVRVKGLGFRM